MSARPSQSYTGSVPNVKRARDVQQAKQAKANATVNKLRASTVGTKLGTFVAKGLGAKQKR